jgi:hypothetical protein
MADKSQTLAFVSSAFNEADNLVELYRRCREAYEELKREFEGVVELDFRFVVADNGSSDGSLLILNQLCREDPAVVALANHRNYGPEASVVNALLHVDNCDLVVLLCSDLQDPPEVAISLSRTLLEKPELDAVLAVKKRSTGSLMLRIARRTYYKILGYSSRLQVVPGGFHGFGCYRQQVLEEAQRYWNSTDLNFRQCLANACQSPLLVDYEQAERLRGRSSYRGWGYWPEALRALVSGDAAASRIALSIGSSGLVLASVLALLLLINVLRGNSGYEGGVPTVMGLVLFSFAVQMLMFAVLSRQIEALRMGGFRPKVRFQTIGTESTKAGKMP